MNRYVALNIEPLLSQALMSRAELAEKMGLPEAGLSKLEVGEGDPRTGFVLHLALEFAVRLDMEPSDALQNLISDGAFLAVDPIYEKAADACQNSGDMRFHNDLQAVIDGNFEPSSDKTFGRIMTLYAKTPYSREDLAEITGISQRQLQNLFGSPDSRSLAETTGLSQFRVPERDPRLSSSVTSNLSLWTLLRLAAVLAPVYEASPKETFYYILEDAIFGLNVLSVLSLK